MIFCYFIIFSSIAFIISAKPQYSPRHSWSNDEHPSNGYQSKGMAPQPSKDAGSYDDFVMPGQFDNWQHETEHSGINQIMDQPNQISSKRIKPSSNPYGNRAPFDPQPNGYQSKGQQPPSPSSPKKPDYSALDDRKSNAYQSNSFDDEWLNKGRSATGRRLPFLPKARDSSDKPNVYDQSKFKNTGSRGDSVAPLKPSNGPYENRLPVLPKEKDEVGRPNSYQSNDKRIGGLSGDSVNWMRVEPEIFDDTPSHPPSNKGSKKSNGRLPFLPKEKSPFEDEASFPPKKKSVQTKPVNPFANYNPLPPGYVPKGPNANNDISDQMLRRTAIDFGHNDHIRNGGGNEYGSY